MKKYKMYIELCKQNKALIGGGLALLILQAVLAVKMPFMMNDVLDDLFTISNKNYKKFILGFSVYSVLFIIQMLSGFASTMLFKRLGIRNTKVITSTLMKKIFYSVKQEPPQFSIGNAMQIMSSDAFNLGENGILILYRTLQASINIGAVFYYMWNSFAPLSVIITIEFVLIMIIQKKLLDVINRKIMENREIREKYSFLVNDFITDHFNYRRIHCFDFFSRKYKNGTSELLENSYSLEKTLFILQAIIDLEPEELSITGGEPLLLSNFSKMIKMLKSSYHGSTALCTNGTLINEDNAADLCNCFDIFDISLDGYDEKSSEAVRGKGTFKKVLSAIKMLKAHNAKLIRLSCAIKGKSKFEKEAFEKLCKELDVQPLIRRLTLSGRAAENELDDLNDYSCFTDLSITSCYDCSGGKTSLTVDWNGDIYPCNNFIQPEYKICNITEKDIRSKLGWKNNMSWFREFSKYLPDKREECKNCEVNMFCWNCPSITKSFIDSRKITSLNSVCSEKKKKILEAIWE